MVTDGVPCRMSSAVYRDNDLWHRRGTLLLYTDRLAFVGSGLVALGAGFGLVGALASQGVAKARAAKVVARGGKNAHVIFLSEIITLEPMTSRRGKARGFVVSTSSDHSYRFIVGKPDEWMADLSHTNLSWYPIIGSALV